MPKQTIAKQERLTSDFRRALRRLMNDHQAVRLDDIAAILHAEAELIDSRRCHHPGLCIYAGVVPERRHRRKASPEPAPPKRDLRSVKP
jgi:hypothetical protein